MLTFISFHDLSRMFHLILTFHMKNHTHISSYNLQAALCSIRIVKKVPDLAENFVNPVVSLLKEKHHGVLLTAIQLCTYLCNLNEEALEFFRKVNILDLVKDPLLFVGIVFF